MIFPGKLRDQGEEKWICTHEMSTSRSSKEDILWPHPERKSLLFWMSTVRIHTRTESMSSARYTLFLLKEL
jgi:hypothetical protein